MLIGWINKKTIIAFILTILILGCVTVYAYRLHSLNVSYSNSDSEYGVNNVKAALDELYFIADKCNKPCDGGAGYAHGSGSGYAKITYISK